PSSLRKEIDRPSGVQRTPPLNWKPGGRSRTLDATPPSIGMITSCSLKPAFSLGIKQAIDFPSGETAGSAHSFALTRTASPPSMRTLHTAHLPSLKDWKNTHLLSAEETGPVAKVVSCVSCI